MGDTENPFIKQNREREEEYARWGLDDLDHADRLLVQVEARDRIRRENIIDDAEKRRIYDEVKAQYKEYETFKERKRSINVQPSLDSEISQEDKDAAEYQRGYQRAYESQREREEFRKSAYRRGYKAAEEEIEVSHAKARELAAESDDIPKTSGEDIESTLEDLAKNNAITQLQQRVKDLDERLRKLEKYTEE